MLKNTEKLYEIANFSDIDFQNIEKFPHVTQMSVLPLIAYKNEKIIPLGTCFSISNIGISLTARHLIDEAYKEHCGFGDDAWTEKSLEAAVGSGWSLGVLYAREPESGEDAEDLVGGIFPITRSHFNVHFDIAVVSVNLPKHTTTGQYIKFPATKVSLKSPTIGDKVLALGYRTMRWKKSTDGVHTHSVAQSYSASQGVVEEVHTNGRDKVHLPFPCFRTSARFDGGMSGGPVFSQDGSVVGVVCSGTSLTDDSGHISYVSLISPVLCLEVLINENGEDKHVSLSDLAERGVVSLELN